ncbi:MAG: anhydro-N-acetylmuramic acid kinase [Gammaproteobacteria bacterium]|nr:anhydro-N-acetylmuramic acid kinase [Gammaproteobacteria bacterium]
MSLSPTLYAGAISGTSVDGLDLALLDTSGATPRIVDARVEALPETLAQELRALAAGADDHLDRVARVDAELGEFIGHAVRRFAGGRSVIAVGSHGQTIRHDPRGRPAYTVQIGDPSRIAECSGIDTVADFRRRDIAAGGEGAPLVPPFHAALLGVADTRRAVLNIGGIANVTFLGDPALGHGPVTGFDTGPGNALLDAWIREHRGEPFDRDGAWSAGARAIPELLGRLEEDAFLAEQPPKSTGKEHYNLAFILRHLEGSEAAARVQATLAEFTAASVAGAISSWGPATAEVVVCGGGRWNADLMRRLDRRLSPRSVTTTDALGVDGDAVEAAAFAWLAYRFVERLPGNAPAVTGAAGPRVLGALYPA